MKKKLILVTSLVVGLLLFGYIAYTIFFSSNNNVGKEETKSSNTFYANYTYQGENLWTYSVTGTLPTPCYSVNTQALVSESYPEQVSIQINVQEEPTEGVCSTVIKDYSYSGTFNASGEAIVNLVVN